MHDWFQPQGLLAKHLSGYQTRPEQEQLSHAIDQAIDQQQTLIAEAGTGTGKTFAYLLPALARGQKTLISTATKNLQEQIYNRDLPLIKKALHASSKVALLKGRSSYLCNQRYESYLSSLPLSAQEKHWRKALETFARKTRDGDLALLHEIPEDAPILREITSTRDNCLGRDCPLFEECYVQQARKRAKEADVVVVNHHLLLADLALKQRGFAEILPDIELFIIDEAHHLPEIATQFLGKQFSHRQLQFFCHDLELLILEEIPDATDIREQLKALLAHSLQLLRHFPSRGEQREENKLIDWQKLRTQSAFWQDLQQLYEQLLQLHTQLSAHVQRSASFPPLMERLVELIQHCHRFLPADSPPETTPNEEDEESAFQADEWALWLALSKQNYTLHATPIDVARTIAPWVNDSDAVWCFLSATLAVDHDFQHYAHRLGIRDYASIQLDSPFNYKHQALLYHPTHLPDPKEAHYTHAFITQLLPVLHITDGRALLLFTSYRALHEAASLLNNQGFQLLIQGEKSKNKLLEQFKSTPKALLLATASFWEGVDIRGESLVCVAIDKLPFTAPNDPFTQARHQYLEKQGISPFIHDTLPKAIISLKQGVGRLIRDASDYGVLVLGDPRLLQKSYGQSFLNSLPPMVRTQKLELVQRFFNYHQHNHDDQSSRH